MTKKKKTRRDKEKAKLRRTKQYKSILSKISDSHNDNIDSAVTKEQVIIGNVSPTPEPVAKLTHINKDLRTILFLAILFIAIIGCLVYFDFQYNVLQILADNLINFLSR